MPGWCRGRSRARRPTLASPSAGGGPSPPPARSPPGSPAASAADDPFFARAVRAWVAPAITVEPHEGSRPGFELVPPRSDGGPPRPDDAQGWQLRFLLIPVNDPSRAVPAATLWRRGGRLTPER